MLSPEKLKQTLTELPFDNLRVETSKAGLRLVAIVSTPQFENMIEAVRQEAVWGHLLEALTEAERLRIDFVFTYTPEEYEETFGVPTGDSGEAASTATPR